MVLKIENFDTSNNQNLQYLGKVEADPSILGYLVRDRTAHVVWCLSLD